MKEVAWLPNTTLTIVGRMSLTVASKELRAKAPDRS